MTTLATMIILVAHFVGDFVLQNDRLATQKSKNTGVLLEHVLLYSLPLTIAAFVLMYIFPAVPQIHLYLWLFLNIVLHFVVDYFTSRANSKIVAKEGMHHNFFLMIGFDQLLHLSILVLTLGFYLL